MRSENGLRLISGNANRPLAEQIALLIGEQLGETIGLANMRVERFKDTEIFVEIFDNVRGEDVFVIQPTSRPANDSLMELLIIIDALRRSSAKRITAVMPYFGYARQDRRTAPRTPISAKLVANLITRAGADRVMTLDLHAGQIQGFFDIPTDNLYASPVFALDLKASFKEPESLVVVSPDVGGVVRATDLARRINADIAIVDKRRPRPGEAEAMSVVGQVAGRDCVIIDDICDSAGTLCKAAERLIDEGARSVHAYVSHGVLSEPAMERVAKSTLRELVITDSIEPSPAVVAAEKIRVVPLAPLIAQAIMNVGHDTSVSSLFDEHEIAPIYERWRPSGKAPGKAPGGASGKAPGDGD